MRLAITGLSLVHSPRRSSQSPTDAVIQVEDLLGALRRLGAVVTIGEAEATFGQKIKRQCDPSTLLGMACLDRALAIAAGGGIDDPTRLGLFCATTLGGVEFSEPQLALQVLQGPERVSAFQAIAWFYAATQGQWTIARGMRGYAKSFTADRAGAINCISGAMLAIEAGHCDAALCAAYDAPLSPYSMALQRAGSRVSADASSFVSEGAGAIFVEPVERALARGAQVFGTILEVDTRVVLRDPDAAVQSSLACVIERVEATGVRVRRVFLEEGQPVWRREIEAALSHLGRERTVTLYVPAAGLGTLLSAGVFADIALGCCESRSCPDKLAHAVFADGADTPAQWWTSTAPQKAVAPSPDCFVVASGTGTGIAAHIAITSENCT